MQYVAPSGALIAYSRWYTVMNVGRAFCKRYFGITPIASKYHGIN